MKKDMRFSRLLCITLAILLACAALVTHSHECSGVSCSECMLRRVFASAMLVFGSRMIWYVIVRGRASYSSSRPAETGETLVQMKVKLSN